MLQLERQQDILRLLGTHKSMTVKELSKELSVSVRITDNDGWSFVSALAGE